MTQNEKTVTTMHKYGGSFIRCLAEAWHAADATNKQRLETAFAPEFLKYEAISKDAGREVQP